MRMVLLALIVSVLTSVPLLSQDTPRAGQPIVLEWADSLVGTGGPSVGVREFQGNVRFRQGNVTVTCDRAVQDPTINTVDLFGNVIVRQDNMEFSAPIARYDGNARFATAQGGITITETGKKVHAERGTYSTAARIATFDTQVRASDDTMLVWSDHAMYYRANKKTIAWGNVVAWDTVGLTRLRGDSLIHEPERSYFRIMGTAAVWDWEPNASDTMYVIADTIERFGQNQERLSAQGSTTIVNGTVAARADSAVYDHSTGIIQLYTDPVVWADSMELLADSITVNAPNRTLSSIVGHSNAIMVSRQDTIHPDRFDQVSGQTVVISIDHNTVRDILATTDARSITYRTEGEQGEGLAKFASDTIKAFFEQGALVDVYWLGGIEGEHQPEHLITGRESYYRLPNFEWRTDKPTYQPLPVPWGPLPVRTPARISENTGNNERNVKKKVTN